MLFCFNTRYVHSYKLYVSKNKIINYKDTHTLISLLLHYLSFKQKGRNRSIPRKVSSRSFIAISVENFVMAVPFRILNVNHSNTI